MDTIDITPLCSFQDNYIWLIQSGSEVVLVDPGEAQMVLEYLEKNQLNLKAVLITHHHADHIGGVNQITMHYPVPVYGPQHEASEFVTHPVRAGSKIFITALNWTLTVLELPGHTLGHIGYFDGINLFSGDVLFGAGCGRIFEGTPNQMLHSLNQIARLPPATRIYCAHEYTLSNLAFARHVDPENPILKNRETLVQSQRAQQIPTVPLLLEEELATNPFLRYRDPSIHKAVERHHGAPINHSLETFTLLRSWKNQF